jgi:hypothetical protein
MNIIDIYKKYRVPSNLSRHMLTVAKIVLFIKSHWKNESIKINWDILLKSALLHDLGNIVKFDLEKHPEIFQAEGEDIGYWKEVQKEMIDKYGVDDHAATRRMLVELKADNRMIEIILSKTFGNSKEIAAENNWHTKILLYADLRVAPHGIMTLNDRLEELIKRSTRYSRRPDFPELIEAARNIEKQIQEKVNFPLSEISDDSVKNTAENIENTDI